MEINNFAVVGIVASFVVFLIVAIVLGVQNGRLVAALTEAFTAAQSSQPLIDAIRGLAHSIPAESANAGLSFLTNLKAFTPDEIDKLLDAIRLFGEKALVPKEITQPPAAPAVKPPLPGTEG